jgi:hypothetical protein
MKLTRPCRRRLATTASDSEGYLVKCRVGASCPPGPLQSLPGPWDGCAARCRATSARLAFACTPSTPPAPVAIIRFLAPPSRLQPPWGLPARGCSRASARGERQTCAWRASEVSGPTAPFPARRRRNGSPGVSFPYDTCELGGSGSPGASTPGTFRPQGLITLSTACAPPSLVTARQPPQHPWDSPFRALLLPVSGTPLGASPLLSFSA